MGHHLAQTNAATADYPEGENFQIATAAQSRGRGIRLCFPFVHRNTEPTIQLTIRR